MLLYRTAGEHRENRQDTKLSKQSTHRGGIVVQRYSVQRSKISEFHSPSMYAHSSESTMQGPVDIPSSRTRNIRLTGVQKAHTQAPPLVLTTLSSTRSPRTERYRSRVRVAMRVREVHEEIRPLHALRNVSAI